VKRVRATTEKARRRSRRGIVKPIADHVRNAKNTGLTGGRSLAGHARSPGNSPFGYVREESEAPRTAPRNLEMS